MKKYYLLSVSSNFSKFGFILVFSVFASLLVSHVVAQCPVSDYRTNSYAASQIIFTNKNIWDSCNGTAWVTANTVPDSTKNVTIQANHFVNIIDNTTVNIAAAKTINVLGSLILGFSHIKGNGTVNVASGGSINFGSKNTPAEAVTDNVNVGGGLIINKGSTTIFSGKTAKTIGPRTFGNVNFMTKLITLTGDITVENQMFITDSSNVTANGNINLGKTGTVSIRGTFNITNKQITGATGTQTVTVQAPGNFVCYNPAGFYGGNGSAGNVTSINSNVENISLQTGSTIKYNDSTGIQYISALPGSATYSKIVMNKGTLKVLAGNAKFTDSLTINSGVVFNCGTNTIAGATSAAIAAIKGTLKVCSLSSSGAVQGNIPVASVVQSSGSTFEFNGTGPQYVDGRSYYNLIVNNGNTVSLAGNAVVNGDLLLNSLNKLDIAGNTLTLNGSLSGSGNFVGSVASNLIMNIPGTLNFVPTFPSNLLNNLTINKPLGTVTLGTDLNIAGVLLPTAGTFDLNNHIVTLKAGTGGQSIFPSTKTYPFSGTVGEIKGTINYGASGAFVIERFIPELRRFRLFSPGLTATGSIRDHWQEGGINNPGYGTHVTGTGGAANGFDPTVTNNPSLFVFNNSTQSWSAITSTLTSGLITAGSAWRLFVRGDRTVDLNDPTNSPPPTPTIVRTKGKLLTGTVTFNTSNAGLPKLSASNLAYSLIGNPYASAVSWDDIIQYDGATNTLKGTVKDLKADYTNIDPTLSFGNNGVFVTYNGATKTNNINGSHIDGNIQPGQAFFVQTVDAATNSTPAPFITFSEANKVSSFTKVFRTPSVYTKLSVQLLFTTPGTARNQADGVAAVFNNSFKETIGIEDSYKINNSSDNLAINRNDTMLCIEGRPAIIAHDTLPLKISQLWGKRYYLKFIAENFPTDLSAFVTDNYLQKNTVVDLADTTLVPFNISTDAGSFASDRFSVIFSGKTVLPVNFVSVKAYGKERGIQVEWVANTEKSISTYRVEKSANGYQFSAVCSVLPTGNNGLAQNYHWLDPDAFEGDNFYRIVAVDKSGSTTTSQVVNYKLSGVKGSITVYPNPVKNSIIGLHISNVEKGTYSIRLFNTSGQLVHSETIEFSGSSAHYNIAIGNKKLPEGTYQLHISNQSTEVEKTVVIQ